MSRRIILAFFLLLSQSRSSSTPILINAVAGKVGDHLITVQDAYCFRAIQRLRSGEHPVIVFETDKKLKATIQKAMLEQMIVEEAKAVSFKDPDPKQTQDIIKRVKEVSAGAEWKVLLKSFSMSEAEAIKRLNQGVLAERFLKKKVDSLTPVITDAEIDEYSRNYPEKVKNLGEKNRSLIAEALKKERIDKGLQDYIDFLGEKYSAAYLLSG